MADDSGLEIVRRGYEAMIAGDVAILMGLFAEDCVWNEAGAPDVPHGGSYRGPAEIMGMLGGLAVITEGSGTFDLEELFSDGAGHVVAIHRSTARRPDTRSIDVREAMIFHVDGGLIRSVRNCYDDLSKGVMFWSEPR